MGPKEGRLKLYFFFLSNTGGMTGDNNNVTGVLLECLNHRHAGPHVWNKLYFTPVRCHTSQNMSSALRVFKECI